MTKELTTIQTKAVDLRGFLQGDKIKNQLAAALPKWLSVDRLLRVVFSSAMKNPAILDCTRESILQAVMECAQLGIEPILGRAYLIPYVNSKKVGSAWVKVPELQMQLGYRGCVDLARRSEMIADIWGENVFERDDFDLRYGMDRSLYHRPWFMDEKKREAGDSGKIIGAYVVWQLKDGTKHPDFMSIVDIQKRRAKSQSFAFAETGDPSRGGGKKNSVWHEWPEEMNLKTVIKHSSKLIPASIEFMQAIEMDDAKEFGEVGIGVFDGTVTLPEPENFDADNQIDLATRFRSAMGDAGNNPKIDDFVRATAKGNGVAVSQIMETAINDVERFKTAFANWEKKFPKESGGADRAGGSETVSEKDQKSGASDLDPTAFVNEWLRLHGQNFEKYVIDNLDRFEKYPEWVQKKAREKFEDKVGKPWPLKSETVGADSIQVNEQEKGEGYDKGQGEIVQPDANGEVDFTRSDEYNELMMLKSRYPYVFDRDIGKSPLTSLQMVKFALNIMSASVKSETGGESGQTGLFGENGNKGDDDIPY